MSATLVENRIETVSKKTVEPAEEVNMENAIETQPPHTQPAPIVQGVNMNGGEDGSVSSESMSESALATPQSSVDSFASCSASPTKAKQTGSATVNGETPDKCSLSETIGSNFCPEDFTAPLATPESISKHNKVKASESEEIKPAVASSLSSAQTKVAPCTPPSSPTQSKASSSPQKDRLEKLAKQIDDFDPALYIIKEPVVEKAKADSNTDTVTFSKDISDASLIDDLIKVSDNEVSKVKGKGKVTPASNGSGAVTLTTDKDGTHLGDELNNMEGDRSPNGSMSASTESDGFQEDAGNSGDETTKDEQTAKQVSEEKSQSQNSSVPAQTKSSESQKSDNSATTKTGKSKRKEDKSIEHILKALSSLQSTEEKLAALCKKYADLHEEHRIVQSSFKQNQRKLAVTSREKDQLQSEHTKAVMAKSKLESLCRELQKHNQTIRQESLQRAKEEDEKRKEISQKFQTTIGEIQTQMQENHDRNKQLREENCQLANKLKKFIEQSEAREKQVEKVIQHRELEQKLADAKLEQASAILVEEKGRSQKERELLIIQSTEYLKKLQLKDTELTMYKERYDEFQSTIKKSEEMFTKFKTEMDKMGKRCKKLEKDGASWKTKCEGANKALIDMAEEKQKYDKERSLLVTKVNKLESLCRAMQAERQARKVLECEKMVTQSDMDKLSLGDSLTAALESSTSLTPGSDAELPGAGPSCSPPEPSTEADSDNNSCASEKTGITVVQQDTSQSQAIEPTDNQSELSSQITEESSQPVTAS